VDDCALYEKSGEARKLVGKFLGEGLVVSEGQTHAEQRKIMQSAFVPRYVAAQADLIAACTQEALGRWITGGRIELGSELKRLSLDVVRRAFFDAEVGGNEDGIAKAMQTFEKAISDRFRSTPWPEWLPTKANRERRAAIRLMDDAIEKLLSVRLSAASDLSRVPNALDVLVVAHQTGKLDARCVRDQLLTIFFAGHETIANLLLWTVYEVASRPELEKAIVSEVRRETARTPLISCLDHLELMGATIKEALRLYPPAWVFDRSPVQDVELGGFRVPKRSLVFVSPYITQRDERWFENPLAFEPRRFLPDANGQRLEDTLPGLSYFPFGAGPRFCIGYTMAMLEAKITLASLFGRCHVTIENTAAPRPEPSVTLGIKDPFFAVVSGRS
jgi:cytochrome P450